MLKASQPNWTAFFSEKEKINAFQIFLNVNKKEDWGNCFVCCYLLFHLNLKDVYFWHLEGEREEKQSTMCGVRVLKKWKCA